MFTIEIVDLPNWRPHLHEFRNFHLLSTQWFIHASTLHVILPVMHRSAPAFQVTQWLVGCWCHHSHWWTCPSPSQVLYDIKCSRPMTGGANGRDMTLDKVLKLKPLINHAVLNFCGMKASDWDFYPQKTSSNCSSPTPIRLRFTEWAIYIHTDSKSFSCHILWAHFTKWKSLAEVITSCLLFWRWQID